MSTLEIMQLVAWIIALSEFILGFYFLVLNLWSKVNWHVGILLFLFGVNSYALGLFVRAKVPLDAEMPATLIAATTPAAQTGLLLVTIVLLKPDWLKGYGRWFWRIVYVLFLLPIALTIIDTLFNTNLWFSGLDPTFFSPGHQIITEYTQGILESVLRPLLLYAISVITVVPLIWITFFDKSISVVEKRLGYILLSTQIAAILLNFLLFNTVPAFNAALITSTFLVIGYGYAAFQHLISTRSRQKGQIQTRLTALVILISIQIMIALSLIMINRAGEYLRDNAIQRLEIINHTISSSLNTWLEFNENALDGMVRLPGIKGMNPSIQKPILENLAETYPHMYLVSTVNLDGKNVARSDNASLKFYGDQLYFQDILEGASSSKQTLIGKTSGQPVLVVAKPIRNLKGALAGVGFYASTLETLYEAIQIGNIGTTGLAFIVDENNQIIAHPDPQYITDGLQDFSLNPAVASMRQGGRKKLVRYSDNNTSAIWVAIYSELDNGWGVIVQQEETDLLAVTSKFQMVVFIFVTVGIVLLSGLTSLAIWQAVQPLRSLTSTAIAITEGDLSKVAPIESDDEIGILAKSFNQMTEQLLELIGSLERRVTNRTKDLEQRSNQLLAAADVGRAASTILNIDELIKEVVKVIRDRFDLYFVGLFLVDEEREWAYLRAGTGSAGRAMLNRQHRIQVGEGMIGWSIANAKSRIALEVGQDIIRLATNELPETRSEAAIPLLARGQVIGAITVQDTNPDRFDEVSISALQTMADLVSIAIDNARLYSESQHALEATRKAYGEISRQSWEEHLQKTIQFRSSKQGGHFLEGELANHASKTKNSLIVPIKVRETIIGELITYKSNEEAQWQSDEVTIIETIVDQLGVALEGARLYEETQRRATFEKLTREVTTRIRETMDLDTILNIAASEFRKTLNLKEVEIRMGSSVNDKEHDQD
jgi:GAF domain-containing protein/HAMP domain-containing protein